jgi:carboxylesterase type B
VCHGAELVYEFHSISFCPGFYQTSDEQRLSWQMMTYWTSFAHGSVPHPNNQPSNSFRLSEDENVRTKKVRQQWQIPPLIHWPQFNNTLQTLRLDIPLSIEIGYNKRNCDFWDTLGYDD